MDNNEKLVVHFDKETRAAIIYIVPYALISFLFFYSFIYFLANAMSPFALTILYGVLFGGTALFFLLMLYGWWAFNDKQPAAILDAKGIWLPRFGLISWQEITDIAPYIIKGVPINTIGIRVKNLNRLSTQSTFAGKSGIFWSKLFGYPPIFLSNLDKSNKEIIVFARKFMKPVLSGAADDN